MLRNSLMVSAVLVFCIGSLCGADDKEPLPVPGKPIKREQFRYDARTFEQWQADLLTDLKVERRVKALEAIAAFAGNGYGAEAATAVMEIMGAYDIEQRNDEDMLKIAGAANSVIKAAGSSANSALLRALEGDQRHRQLYALDRLVYSRTIGDLSIATPILIKLAKDKHERIRNSAIEVLATQPGAKGAVDVLRGVMKEGKALLVLHRMWFSSADITPLVADIENLARGGNQPVREIAVQLLVGHLKNKGVAEAVMRLLNQRDRLLILNKLENRNAAPLLPAIVKMVTDPEEEVRLAAVRLLTFHLNQERVVPVLSRVMKEGNVAARGTIVGHLPSRRSLDDRCGSEEETEGYLANALPLYLLALQEKNADLRKGALQLLFQGAWRSEQSLTRLQPAIVRLMLDQDDDVRRVAAAVLRVQGVNHAVPELLDIVRRDESPARARVTGITVLRKESADNKDVIEVLSSMTKDKHPEVRQAAEEFNAERQRRLEQRKNEEE